MMLLVVSEGQDTGKQLEIEPGRIYTIGRDSTTCHLVLSDLEASRSHAEIYVADNGKVTLTDNNSQNGTFLNSYRINSPVRISPGDRISIGKTTIELSTVEKEHLSKQQESSLHSSYHHAVGSVISLGRDPSNNIVLDHPQVSRHHAVVETTDSGTFIKDLNSTNGTYVDGQRISGKHPLSTDSVIRIYGYRLTLDDFQLVTHDETAGQVDLVVRDMSKVVTLPNGEELVILNNINFQVKPREFVAILGGSGSGKTTMLNALMGTSPATFGEILINGTNFYEEYGAFQSLMGYVPQDDIVHLELTVEEVLQYAARLRMPDDTSTNEIHYRVEEVMEILELTFRRDTPVKRLSGGQRKRVSIGVEIITKPSIMFLDEPTSGLDPGLEKLMMRMMRNMANQGQTIFCVTHATFNIHMCDKIIFLTAGGRLAFFGSPREALEYFGTDDFAEIYRKINQDETPEEWQYRYSVSSYAAKYYPHGYEEPSGKNFVAASHNKKSPILQWLTLTSRYFKVMTRDKKNLMLLFLQPIIIALGMGVLMSDSIFEKSIHHPDDLVITQEIIIEGRSDEVQARIDDESSRFEDMMLIILVSSLCAVWFGACNSVGEIVKENSIYKRERSINLKIAPYLLSKSSVLGLIGLAQSILYVGILWIFIGVPDFLLLTLAFFLVILSSSMMGLTISAFVASTSSATSMLPIVLLPQVILSGGLFPIADVEPESAQMIFNIAVAKWGFELIGGGVLDVNNLVAFKEPPYPAFEGSFEAHWWWLIGLTVMFFVIAVFSMLKKDKELT
jgi:ABC transport system ATP-binding/permease protein